MNITRKWMWNISGKQDLAERRVEKNRNRRRKGDVNKVARMTRRNFLPLLY